MRNRNSYSPILFAGLLSLGLGCHLFGATDTLPTATPAPAPAPTPPPPAASTNTVSAPTTTEQPTSYTVVSGDTLWDLSHKFHCTVKQLKTLNNLKKNALKPGQILKIPPAKAKPAAVPASQPATTPAPPKTTSSNHPTSFPQAQPVQDFDIPASTFASCPTPPDSSQADTTTPEGTTSTPEPIVEETPAPRALPVAPSTTDENTAFTGSGAEASSKSISASITPLPKFTSRTPLNITPSNEWAGRFMQVAHDLGNRDIDYNDSWRPPGEEHPWVMDCSNTARYIYKVTAGIQLPRTASDQYYYLHLQNKAWDVPQTSTGFADCDFLRRNLKPGDLLFWENTYKPDRQPPITHVMVFLGKNDKGEWIMAGSQTGRGGEHNRRHGGPDIYVFNPTQPCGGYTTWLGMVHHQGRFCAYGRPLEADKAKLAVAAND